MITKHEIEFSFDEGSGADGIIAKVICLDKDNPDRDCRDGRMEYCQLDNLYKDIGIEVLKFDTSITLATLPVEADWSDPEEPWLVVKDD